MIINSNIVRLFLFASLLIILGCTSYKHLQEIEHTDYRFDTEWQGDADQKLETMIAPYREAMSEKMDVVIGEVEVELVKEKPESTLGNFFTDAIESQGRKIHGEDLDFAVQNYGGLRLNSIGIGSFTLGRAYELMPFDNLLTVLVADSSMVQRFCDKIVEEGGWPVSSSLKIVAETGRAKEIYIRGEKLESGRKYTFCTNDYIVNGGSGCGFLNESDQRIDYPNLFRDMMIDYVKELTSEGRKINPRIEGRITIINTDG